LHHKRKRGVFRFGCTENNYLLGTNYIRSLFLIIEDKNKAAKKIGETHADTVIHAGAFRVWKVCAVGSGHGGAAD